MESFSLQTPAWLVFLRTICALAEGTAKLVNQTPHSAAAACVVAVFRDSQHRVAVLGGREGMSRSLGSVYGSSVTRFLSGFRGGFSRAIETACIKTSYGGTAVSRDGCMLLVPDYSGGTHAIHIYNVQTGAFLRKIGGYGKGPLQFKFPSHVWVASDGFVFVVEYRSARIQILTPHYEFHKFVGKGHLYGPFGVCANDDAIVVVDVHGHRVCVFRRDNGTFLRRFGSEGSGDRDLCTPRALCIMPGHGNIAVADTGNRRVSVFTLDGKFVRHVGVGKLLRPGGVACSSADELVVADLQRVLVFSASGEVVWTGAVSRLNGIALHGSTIYCRTGQTEQDGKCVVLT